MQPTNKATDVSNAASTKSETNPERVETPQRGRSDRVFGVLLLALSVFMAWRTDLIVESFIQDPLGPKVFPWMTAAAIGGCGLFMLVRPDAEVVWPKTRKLIELLVSVLVMVAYAELLPLLGFVLSTVFAAAFFAWRLGASGRQSVGAGVILAVGIYLIFHSVLGLSLARGPWGF